MSTFEAEIEDYLTWMIVHNYAVTTVGDRRRYLCYFRVFAEDAGATSPSEVTYELVVSYLEHLHHYRKANGATLSVATQVQRLVPVTQFFTWLRREHRLDQNPAADLLMPRPDRRLPEATLSAPEMARLMAAPDITRPLGLRDRARSVHARCHPATGLDVAMASELCSMLPDGTGAFQLPTGRESLTRWRLLGLVEAVLLTSRG